LKKKPAVIVEVERMKHPYTGLYYYCLQLAENLEKYHGDEFDFTFFKYPGVYLPEHLKSVNRNFLDKIYLYKDYKYDVWHGTWQLTKYVPKGKIKFVYTVHDLNFLYTDKPQAKKNLLLEQIQQRIDRADIVTTISEYVKNDIETHLDTRSKDIVVIYNGVDLKEYPGFDTPGYRPGKPFLFAIGTVLYKKHFHVLPALLKNNDFELVIAGIHPDKNYIKQIWAEAEKHNVRDRVKLIGPVNDKEKYWYLKNSEAFLFPSVSEGFGIPPIEAMRLGKPVFLSKYTSLPEIGGDVAYYFENFEPEHMQKVLEEGLKDYKENNRAEEIKRWSLKFTWDKAAKQYADVYKRVLAEKPVNSRALASTGPERKKLTAIIPTFNEETNIEAAIESVSWADEILIIDSISHDKTLELAEKKGVRVIQRKFDNFSAQKNFAIEKATYDWILVLDADERITEELKNEILLTLKNPGAIAYWIPRQNFLGKKKIRFSGWQNDKCIRLFHRKYAKYNGRFVHEEIQASGSIGKLKNPLLHYTYKNDELYAKKLNLYSKLKAEEWYQSGKKYNPLMQVLNSAYRFFKHYILHFGFLDGKEGFTIARHNMKAVWNRYENLKKRYQTDKK
jgi:glycosyltransferase involved in cell wall biosynthesis